MVFTGKPSAGCENCRRAKKRCDLGLPSCERCVRLGKTCGGYRDINDLIFKDQSAAFSRPVGTSERGSSIPENPTRPPSLDRENLAKAFFYQQFVAPGHFAFLKDAYLDDRLERPTQACAMVALANRQNRDSGLRELGREHYVASLADTNEALRDPLRVREDSTLVAVFLLGMYERLDWERRHSMQSLATHIRGLAMVLQLRGRSQIRTRTGVSLFRDLRSEVLVDALWSEMSVGDHISEWTQTLDLDPGATPSDNLAITACKMSRLRQSFRSRSVADAQLLDAANVLERELIRWRDGALARGSLCSFRAIKDPTSPLSYCGTRHEYKNLPAFRQWNFWRSLRIMLSRIQEAIWRRSWPTLQQPPSGIPPAGAFSSIRKQVVDEVCAATAYALGNGADPELEVGTVSSGMLMANPLLLAASCKLEELAEVASSPGGSRIISIDREFHHDASNSASTQLAWMIDRIDYIADGIGVRSGHGISRFLRGQPPVHFDLGRSNITTDVDAASESSGLDLSTMRIEL